MTITMQCQKGPIKNLTKKQAGQEKNVPKMLLLLDGQDHLNPQTFPDNGVVHT